jgi:hypothetical protein
MGGDVVCGEPGTGREPVGPDAAAGLQEGLDLGEASLGG